MILIKVEIYPTFSRIYRALPLSTQPIFSELVLSRAMLRSLYALHYLLQIIILRFSGHLPIDQIWPLQDYLETPETKQAFLESFERLVSA